MTDGLSTLYQDLLGGSYDCVDRIVLNAYFRMGHDPGGFRVWWRALTGSDETLENAYLRRMAGRFSRRIRGYAKAHDIGVIDCPAGQRKHELAEAHLAKTRVTQGLFLVLVGRAQAPVWDVSAKHHIDRKKPMPYVSHYSFHILDPDSMRNAAADPAAIACQLTEWSTLDFHRYWFLHINRLKRLTSLFNLPSEASWVHFF
jgi:hypothetical protein